MTNDDKSDLRYIMMDLTITALALLLLAVFQSDIIFGAMFVVISAYFVATQRSELLFPLTTASFIATIWMYAAQDYYAYDRDFHRIGNMNLWPWSAWAWGLFLACYLYRVLEAKYPIQGRLKHLLAFSTIFWLLLIFAETVAYHGLELRNTATQGYEGLALCDCIHGPGWMQASYLAMGPLYFILTRCLLVLKSRARLCPRLHHRRKKQRHAFSYLISLIIRN